MTSDLAYLFERDLNRLIQEIKAFKKDADLWVIAGDIKNTPGNLAMHVAGNLRHFIGKTIGNTSYKRNRDFEFNGKLSRNELIEELKNARLEVKQTFDKITINQFFENYPLEVFGNTMSTFRFMVHLNGHLNYHLGQINYCRRILES